MKNEKNNFWEKVVRRGICGVSTLIVGSGVVMMAPMTMAEAAGSATSDVVVTLDSVISMGVYSDSELATALPDTDSDGTGEVNMTALPGGWVTSPVYVGVATNNASGYTLRISPEDGTTTSLVMDANNSIAAASGTVSASDMQNGATRWGFTVDNSDSTLGFNNKGNYKGLTVSPTTLKTTSGPTGVGSTGCGSDQGLLCDATEVTFGTKVGSEVVSGTYTNTVTFTAVTNNI